MNAKDNGEMPISPIPQGEISLDEFTGLTKREWLAGMADVPWNAVLDTMTQQCVKPNGTGGNFTVTQLLENRSRIMVLQADALLAELAKK